MENPRQVAMFGLSALLAPLPFGEMARVHWGQTEAFEHRMGMGWVAIRQDEQSNWLNADVLVDGVGRPIACQYSDYYDRFSGISLYEYAMRDEAHWAIPLRTVNVRLDESRISVTRLAVDGICSVVNDDDLRLTIPRGTLLGTENHFFSREPSDWPQYVLDLVTIVPGHDSEAGPADSPDCPPATSIGEFKWVGYALLAAAAVTFALAQRSLGSGRGR